MFRTSFPAAASFCACLALPDPSLADRRPPCAAGACGADVTLVSVSDLKRYGLLIAAPDEGCRRVRFRIEGPDAGLLGRTPPLRPGELALVRFARGFAQGPHPLVVTAEGCGVTPAAARAVTLAKAAPDHGWRAAEALRLRD